MPDRAGSDCRTASSAARVILRVSPWRGAQARCHRALSAFQTGVRREAGDEGINARSRQMPNETHLKRLISDAAVRGAQPRLIRFDHAEEMADLARDQTDLRGCPLPPESAVEAGDPPRRLVAPAHILEPLGGKIERPSPIC